jgi:acetoin utilization deacetylase AcuC-like enzyme
VSRTGFVWHERYAWHDIGTTTAHFPSGGWLQPDVSGEHPEGKRRLRNLLDVSGLLDELVELRPRPATEAEVCRLHTSSYVRRIREQAARGGGDAGEMTPFGRDSYDVALLAAGGAMVATEAVVAGQVRNAYALVRPPGHHAERDRGRGFCIFGNTALAALHAQQALGVERVAVLDWDVHHGNGTQAAFYADPSVLTVSIHQERNFPQDSGTLAEVGEGAGRGFNLNVPLPPGSGTGAYEAALDAAVLPLLRRFRPQLMIVACGYDASALDPYGRQLLHSAGFRALAQRVLDAADELCDGRVVMVHEGGYSTPYVPFCGLAVIEEMAGVRTAVEDPFLDELAGIAGQDLQPHQRAAIAEVAAVSATLAAAPPGSTPAQPTPDRSAPARRRTRG